MLFYLDPLRQHCIRFLPVQCCSKSIKRTLNKIFSYPLFPGSSWATLHSVLICVMLAQEHYDNIEQDFFLLKVIWSLSGNVTQSFQKCNVIPSVLRQYGTRSFLMQCCLEPSGQHRIGFWPVQCCPKSIKAKLHRSLSCPMLSETSRTTLHRVFSCAMLS